MKRLALMIALVLALCAASVCAAAEAAPEAVDPGIEAYLETWVAEDHSLEIYLEDDGSLSCGVMAAIDDSQDYRWTYENLTYDAESGSLYCEGQGVKKHFAFSEDYEVLNTEEVATGLSAIFTLDEDDKLEWIETAENAGEGLAFVRLDAAEALMSDTRSLRLGSSQYVVRVDGGYIAGDLSEEDIADDQVGYYSREGSPMDFDVYQFSKDGLNERLSNYSIEEAAVVGTVSMVKAVDEINGIPVAWYRATDAYDGERYETLTYLLDDGDSYVKLVFWLDGDDAEAEVDAIMQTLSLVETQELRLGTSPYYIRVLSSYVPGEVNEEEKAHGQVGFYESEQTQVDFDVYQFSKDGLAEELSRYVLEEAAMYEHTIEIDTSFEINGINLAWYRSVEEYEGENYETVTYIMDNGDEYVELVFWVDGPTAEEEVNAIVKSLYLSQPRQVALGDSDYTLVLPDTFRDDELRETDADMGHVGNWTDADDALELDVYQYPKEDLEGSLEAYLRELANGQEDAVTYNADDDVNGIPVAWCQLKADYDGSEFNTKTYILDDGENYIEATFWMKSDDAEATVDAIIDTLARVEAETEVAGTEAQG